MTPDYFTPSTACLIQERLGLNDQEVMCFDLNAACSGFVYALTVAQALLQNMEDKYALVIGSEEISKINRISKEYAITCCFVWLMGVEPS